MYGICRMAFSGNIRKVARGRSSSKPSNGRPEQPRAHGPPTTAHDRASTTVHRRPAMVSPEVRSAEIDVKYSEVYDTAPPLPRPLKTTLTLSAVTKEGLLEEAMSIAPLDAVRCPSSRALLFAHHNNAQLVPPLRQKRATWRLSVCMRRAHCRQTARSRGL